MNLNLPGLLDLTPVFAVFAILGGSAFSTSNILQWARNLFLDNLTGGMGDTQRVALLRSVLFVLNFAVVLVLALFMHFALSPQLLLSVALGAAGSTGGAHFTFVHIQKTPATSAAAPQPDEIPDGGPGIPPTDSPASAALPAAA